MGKKSKFAVGLLTGVMVTGSLLVAVRTSQPPGSSVNYRIHVQKIGWQNWLKKGALARTTGQAKRLEAIMINVDQQAANKLSGSIEYQTCVQKIG